MVTLNLIARTLLLLCILPSSPCHAASHPHRILVQSTRPFDLARLEANCASLGHQVERFSAASGLAVVRLPANDSVAVAIARYRSSSHVRFAEPDYVVSAATVLPGDPYFQNGTQWALNNYGQSGGLPDADLDAPEAWDVIASPANVIVAIVDSGIRYTHEDLAPNLWTNPIDGSHGFNAIAHNLDPWDDNGHGTHVAGIIGAAGDNGRGIAGVAFHVQLMACKFLDNTGNGFNSDAVACIDFARTNGAHVINLSWGGDEYSEAVSNAIASARAAGIIVVAAAGNAARNIDFNPYYPASLRLDNIVSVAASTRTDSSWSLSNYGMASVDLFAPGAAIFSTASTTDTAYASRDGSSMASAFVSGAFALLRRQEPGATVSQLISRLLSAVDHPSAFNGKCASGGRLNLRKALDRPTLFAPSNAFPFTVAVRGISGHPYTLESSSNLTTWSALRTNIAPPTGEWFYTDTNSIHTPRLFFRASPAP